MLRGVPKATHAGAEPAAAWTDVREGAAWRKPGRQKRAPRAPIAAVMTDRVDFIDDLLKRSFRDLTRCDSQ
jgi:hypothetical protein